MASDDDERLLDPVKAVSGTSIEQAHILAKTAFLSVRDLKRPLLTTDFSVFLWGNFVSAHESWLEQFGSMTRAWAHDFRGIVMSFLC